jgi:hypothetical protein
VKRVISRSALTGRKINAEEAIPAGRAARRTRQDGGASVNFRVPVGGGNVCFESVYDYRGGCDGGGRR